MEFKEYRLEEIALNITDGVHNTVIDDSSGEYYLLSCKNIKDGKVNITSNDRKINQDTFDKLKKRTKLSKGDFLITTVGTIGEMAFIKDENINYDFQRSVGIIKPNIKFVIPEFLYYSLNNEKDQINTFIKGAVQKCLFIGEIKNIVVKFPSLENQKKIIKILSCLDRKIDVNKCINENLQKTSQELYKRWFVDFEFPDENGKPYKSSGGKMVESELGMIPEDWKVGYISDGILTSIIKPGISLYDGEKKYVATADVVDVSIKNFQNISYANRPSRANMKPINNSVWFAKMQGSNKNILVDKNCKNIIDDYIFSTGFMGLECEKNSIYYIWNYINTDSFSILKDNMSTGTLMAGLSNSAMNNFKYIIPNQRLLDSFNEILSSFYSIIFHNINVNDNLENIKNILLPKLMNGEIELDSIEI